MPDLDLNDFARGWLLMALWALVAAPIITLHVIAVDHAVLSGGAGLPGWIHIWHALALLAVLAYPIFRIAFKSTPSGVVCDRGDLRVKQS